MCGRLQLNKTLRDNILIFAGNNPGALTTLTELFKYDKEDTGKFAEQLLLLDFMGLYESHLYMLWNDCCNRNIKKVAKIIELYEEQIITQEDINERIKNVGYGKSFDDFFKEDKINED